MDNLFFEITNLLFGLIKPFLAALSPLLAGLIIAYLLDPVVSRFEKKMQSRGLAILFTYILSASLIVLIVYGFVVLMAGALPKGGPGAAVQLVRDYFADAVRGVNTFLGKHIPMISPEITEDAVAEIQNWFSRKFLLTSVINTLQSVTGALVSFFIGCVASIYLLKDKDFFISLWEKLLVLFLPQRVHGIVSEVAGQVNGVVSTFIKGALIDSIIVAFLSSIVLTLLQVKFAVVMGTLGGILNIIPYFGPFISMIPAFLAALLSGGPLHGLAAVSGLLWSSSLIPTIYILKL